MKLMSDGVEKCEISGTKCHISKLALCRVGKLNIITWNGPPKFWLMQIEMETTRMSRRWRERYLELG